MRELIWLISEFLSSSIILGPQLLHVLAEPHITQHVPVQKVGYRREQEGNQLLPGPCLWGLLRSGSTPQLDPLPARTHNPWGRPAVCPGPRLSGEEWIQPLRCFSASEAVGACGILYGWGWSAEPAGMSMK